MSNLQRTIYEEHKALQQTREELDEVADIGVLQHQIDNILTEGLHEMRKIVKTSEEDGNRIKAFNAVTNAGRYLEQRKINERDSQKALVLDYEEVMTEEEEDGDEES